MSILMSSSVVETTEEILTRLHNEKLKKTEDVVEYLLNAMEFLKTGDLDGWKKMFVIKEPEQKRPVKRLRQSPTTAAFSPMKICKGCQADEVIDDVVQGQYVCIQCGLIQQLGVFMGDIVHCSMDRLKNGSRVHIHRYSRVVHFRSIIRLMQGDSNPDITEEELSRMQAELGGKNCISVEDVTRLLLKLGWSRKYRRHRYRLAYVLGKVDLPVFDGTVIMTMLKKFRILEYHWDRHHDEISPGRLVFFSYRFVFYQFCHMMGYPQYTGRHHLLKNERLSRFQFDSYHRASKFTGFPVYDPE